jgi:hypothetical protein
MLPGAFQRIVSLRSCNEFTQPSIKTSGASLDTAQERVGDRQALEQRNPSRGCRLHQRLTGMASSHDGEDVPSAAGL